MRKYRIYSGAKPTSADKTFAVNWGGKYFTVSSISAVQYVPSLTLSNISTSGNTLSVTCSNNENDSTKMTPYVWYCANENVNSGTSQLFSFSDATARIFGPKTNVVYSWDVSSALKPGTNTISASFQSTPVLDYQTGSLLSTTNKLAIYKKYTAPNVGLAQVFSEGTYYGSSNSWDHDLCRFVEDKVNYFVKISNPNTVSAAVYRGSTKIGTVSANSSMTDTNPYFASGSSVRLIAGAAVYSSSFSTPSYFLDSSVYATNANTKSVVAQTNGDIPKHPILVSCMPTSASSSNFQVTVKNPNPSQYYCRVEYNLSGGSSHDYWLINCPANGTGTMIDSAGTSSTFSFVRGSIYVLTLYFYTLNGSSLSYSGTQVSGTVKYPYKAPDSGFLYASPVVEDIFFDNDNSPSTVTFAIFNINNTTLKTEMDLYTGSGTSGTRVDYWTTTVSSMSTEICPNTWRVHPGLTYTLRCYFMNTSSSYHGTAVSGYTDYTFTTPSES